MRNPPADKPMSETKRARSWKRRILRVLMVTVAVAVLVRVGFHVLFPIILRKTLAAYGLDGSYERMDASVLVGDTGLWHLKIIPLGGGEPVLTAEYCRLDISIKQLLTGNLTVYRVEADGAQAVVERLSDGSIPLLERFVSAEAQRSASPTTAPAGGPLDLIPPVTIDAVRLSNLRLNLKDQSVSPVFETTVNANVRLSDLGSAVRKTTLLVEVFANPVLDLLRIEGTGGGSAQAANGDFRVTLRGLHPKAAESYLRPLGLRPVADTVAGEITFTATATVPSPQSRDLSIKLNATRGQLRADGKEILAMDNLSVDAPSVTAPVMQLGSVLVDGVRCAAVRSPGGSMVVAGLEIVPVTAVADRATTSTSQQLPVDLKFKLDTLKITNVVVGLSDQSQAKPAELSLHVSEALVQNLVNDPAQPDAQTTIAVRAAAPGISTSLTVDGTARPSAETRTLDLSLLVEGINPEALAPYLEALGLRSELKSGRFAVSFHSELAMPAPGVYDAAVQVKGLRFTDTSELFSLDSVDIARVRYDTSANHIRINSVEVSGPRTGVVRDVEGVLRLVGLRTVTSISSESLPSSQPAGAPATDSSAPLSLPSVELGSFVWKGIAVAVEDQSRSPASKSMVSDAGIELSNIRFDPSGKSDNLEPGKLRAWLNVPGIAHTLEASGAVAARGRGLQADVTLAGKGITLSAIAPYVKVLGLEPVLKDGALAGRVRLTVAQQDDGLAASLAAEGISLTDSGAELAAVDSAAIEGLKLTSGTLHVESLSVERPRAVVTKSKDGALVAGGIRIRRPPEPIEIPEFDMPVATIGRLRVDDAALRWTDQSVEPAVDTTATASVSLEELSSREGSNPARLRASAKVSGAVEQASVEGTLLLTPTAQSLAIKALASGVGMTALSGYLPPGMTVDLKDGRATASVQLDISKVPAGGHAVVLQIAGVDYRDGQAPPLFKLGALKAHVERIDVPGGVIAVKELSTRGIETDVHLGADGAVSLLGLTMRPVELPPPTEAPTTQPVEVAAVNTQVTTAEELAARSRREAPLVTLESLDLRLDRLTVHDDSRPNAAPVSLSGITLNNESRIEALGKDPASRPPVAIKASGRIDPIVGRFDVSLRATPFALEPNLQLELQSRGISGPGLVAVVPELQPKVDASKLTDGQFVASLDSDWKIQQRGPLSFDLARGIDLKFRLKGVAFRDTADGPVLAGVEAVESDGVHFEPLTGALRIKTLEITKPMGQVVRKEDGIHVLGLVVKLPETGADSDGLPPPTTLASAYEPPDQSEPETLPSAVVAATAPAPRKPAAEQKIDRLLIGGIDFRIEDHAVDPVLLVVLNGLDVEARDLSSFALYEPLPIRFSALLNAAKVPMLDGKTGQTTDRETFSQISASGKVAMHPSLDGWVNIAINGFDLIAARGEVKPTGLDIGGGVFDGTINLRFVDDQTIATRAKLSFTDLSLTEPPDGPLHSALKLPAPIDAVIGMLSDADGAITLPVSVQIKQGELRGVGAAAAGAAASVIATAVASTPLKVVGGFGGLLGAEGSGKKPIPPVDVTFAAGDSGLSSLPPDWMQPLVDQMRRDKSVQVVLRHQLGSGDLARAQQRANPTPEEALALAYRLGNRRVSLEQQRSDLAAEARAALATLAPEAAAPTLLKLRDLDRQIAQTNDALDAVYDLLKPGADRQTSRRTRAVALEIAEQRLEAVRDALLASRLPNIDSRVRVSNPQFSDTSGGESGKVEITPVRAKKP